MNYQEFLYEKGILPCTDPELERAMLDHLNKQFGNVDHLAVQREVLTQALAFVAGYIAGLNKAKWEWSGSPCQEAPDTCWVNDKTGEHVSAVDGTVTRHHIT